MLPQPGREIAHALIGRVFRTQKLSFCEVQPGHDVMPFFANFLEVSFAYARVNLSLIEEKTFILGIRGYMQSHPHNYNAPRILCMRTVRLYRLDWNRTHGI